MSVSVTQILPGGGALVYGIDINEQGEIIGWDGSGFTWQDGVLTRLASGAEAFGINDAGETVGQIGSLQAAILQGPSATILPVIPASSYYYANGVNSAGEIVGTVETNATYHNYRAIAWQQGQPELLPTLGTGTSDSKAEAVNDQGEIVGYSTGSDGWQHAVAWVNGAITDLGTLPGDLISNATAVDASGEVAGTSLNHAVVWIGGKISQLSDLAGETNAYTFRINDQGVVVGYEDIGIYLRHAVAWIDGWVVDLNNLLVPGSGWVLEEAAGINDHNQIVGWGSYNGVSSAFVLTLPADVGPTVSVASVLTAGSNLIAGSSIGDSAANIAASLDQIETLYAAGKLSAIGLTDSGTPNLTVTSAQFAADSPVLNNISGLHSITVEVSGTASQHDFSADHWTGINALQFIDQTVIVAAAPGSASAVTTGNVTELYSAVLAREPDAGGLAYYQNYLKTNPSTPLQTFADYFLNSTEYKSHHSYATGTGGDTQFITDSYQNLLHRTPSADEISFYLTNVMRKPDAHALMLVYFSASPEFLSDVQITAQNPASAQHWLLLT